MKYQRKIRWANYGTLKCKQYLRNDFSHECAYCKLQEKEVGLIDSDYFEIDHFRPQSDDDTTFNAHVYSNLYYSCEKCNGEKSDTWSELLLDPCRNDIFSGECPPITGGYNPTQLYKYKGENDNGNFYISTFKLNSRHQVRIRKRRINMGNNIRIIDELMDEILHKFSSKKNLENSEGIIKQLDALRITKKNELAQLSNDANFELVEQYLSKLGIKSSIVFEEYNMDIKIKIGNDSYYCELLVDVSKDGKDEKTKRLDIEKLKVWYDKLTFKFGVLFYYPNLDKLYFYPVSSIFAKEDLEGHKSMKQIKLTDDFLIA